MAKVSIIVPCYNSEKYIEKCIKSFANQTYKDFDLYIIDDCSKDGSTKKIIDCTNKYHLAIHLLINKSNIGPSLTRKRGIEESTSEFIAFCDSDDTYEPFFLEKMMKAVEEGNDVAFCNYNVISRGKSRKRIWLRSGCFDHKTLIAEGPDSLCCLMVNSFIVKGMEFPDIKNGEDMATVPVILSKAQRIGYVNECLYNYVYRESSLSSKIDDTVVDSLKMSFEYLYKMLKERYFEECVYLGVRNYLYGSLLNLFKAKPPNYERAEVILKEFTNIDSNWENNKYIKELPLYKNIFLKAANTKMFSICTIMAKIHGLLM